MQRVMLFVFLCTSIFAGAAFAQAPRTMSYQGVLTDGDGVVVPDGSQTISFRLYDKAVIGTLLWEESLSVTTAAGRFNVVLGETVSLNGLPFDQPYFLGVVVDGGTELTPREPLTASPYSLSARTVEGGLVRSVNGLSEDINLIAGDNVNIDAVGNSLELSAAAGPPISVVFIMHENRADAGDTDQALASVAVTGPDGPITNLTASDFFFTTLWVPAGGAGISFDSFTNRGNGQYTFRLTPGGAGTWLVGGYHVALVVLTSPVQSNTVALLTVDM